MTYAEADPDAAGFWAVHAGHIVLLAVWVAIVGGFWLRAKLRERPAASLSRSLWLWVAAVATAVSAGIHLSVVREHFAESTLYGAFFLVLTAAQLGWCVWLLVRPSRTVLLAGAAASFGVAILWLATRTIGIPIGPAAGETEAFGALDIAASALEVLVAAVSLVAVRATGSLDRTRPSVRNPVLAPLR